MVNKPIHPGNLNTFLEVYGKQLLKARIEHPDDYIWPIDQLPQVLERMSKAIERGSFNKDSHAFKATCKELNIKHTYKAIKEFIEL